MTIMLRRGGGGVLSQQGAAKMAYLDKLDSISSCGGDRFLMLDTYGVRTHTLALAKPESSALDHFAKLSVPYEDLRPTISCAPFVID